MLETKPDLPLPAVKALLGQPETLDYRALNLVDAHRKLGEQVRAQVHRILRRKLQEFPPEMWLERLRLSRNSQAVLRRKLEQPGDAVRRAALEEYVMCLSAWGQGADLAAFDAEPVDGQPVSADDLAYLLQDDDVGCQTGLWRTGDGSVYLTHTEEDREPFGARFDRLRLLRFTLADKGHATEAASFVYPDLLPGPAFAWRSDNYIQAVDSLDLRSKPPASGCLANVATWVTLRLGKSADLDETIRYLAPFVDGYALNVAYGNAAGVMGQKVEFAGPYTHSQRLAEAPGSFLFQVNKFSDPEAPVAQLYESATPEKRRRLGERLARAESWLQARRPSTDDGAALFDYLCSREGDDYACANQDVKAYLIAHSERGQLRVSLGAGPALAADQPETYLFSS